MKVISVNLHGLSVDLATPTAVSTPSYSTDYAIDVNNFGYDSNTATGTFDVLLETSLSSISSAIDSHLLQTGKVSVDSLSVAERFSKSYIKVLVDSIALSDVLLQTEVEGLITGVTTLEVVTQAVGKLLVEQPAIYETFVRSLSKALEELVIAADAPAKMLATSKSEAAVADDVVELTPSKVLAASAVSSDALVCSLAALRNDSAAVIESMQRQLDKSTVSLASATDSSAMSVASVQSAQATVADVFSRFVGYQRTYVDGLTSIDSVAKTLGRALFDTVTLSDASIDPSLYGAYLPDQADATTLSELLEYGLTKAVPETVNTPDIRSFTFTKVFTDVISITADILLEHLHIDSQSPLDLSSTTEQIVLQLLRAVHDNVSTADAGGVYSASYFAEVYVEPSYNGELLSSF